MLHTESGAETEAKAAELRANKHFEAVAAGKLGLHYIKNEQYNEAVNWLSISVLKWDTTHNIDDYAGLLMNYGIALYRNDDYTAARNILYESVRIAEKNADHPQICLALLQVAGVNFLMKNFEEAAINLDRYEIIVSTTFSPDEAQRLSGLRHLYDVKKTEGRKQQQVLIEKQKKLDQYKLKLLLLIAGGFLLLIVLFAIAYITRRNHLHRLAMQHELEKQEKKRLLTVLETEHIERMRLSRDLHDELGSGLSRMLLSIELTKEKYQQNSELVKFFDETAASARSLHENMNGLIWFLNSGSETLDLLFSKMREFALNFFQESQIACNISLPRIFTDRIISMNVFRNILLAFKESLNNVLKHAAAANVFIETEINGRLLSIKIRDDGIGFDPEYFSQKGNGLRNIKERIESIGGGVTLISSNNSGTTITISVEMSEINTD